MIIIFSSSRGSNVFALPLQWLSIRDMHRYIPWQGKPEGFMLHSPRCLRPTLKITPGSPGSVCCWIPCKITHPAFYKKKEGALSIISNTAASVWKRLPHIPSSTPRTRSPQKAWWGVLGSIAAQPSADSITILKFNMRLLSAEQLWAQIGFFYYGQKGQVKF